MGGKISLSCCPTGSGTKEETQLQQEVVDENGVEECAQGSFHPMGANTRVPPLIKVFLSNHQTQHIVNAWSDGAWLGVPFEQLSLQSSGQEQERKTIRVSWHIPDFIDDVKASWPPYNAKDAMPLTDGVVKYNVPCFEPRVIEAAIAMFDSVALNQQAEKLSFSIPRYQLNSVVQDKLSKVNLVITEAKKRSDINESPNKEALERLEQFVQKVSKMPSCESVEAWNEFVGKHVVTTDWKDRLHMDIVLSNFGFDDIVVKELSALKADGKALNTWALRWLSKAFMCYGILGSLADVVNLVYIMLNVPTPDSSDPEVSRKTVEVLNEIQLRVAQKNWEGLWLPSHFVHDAEVDDMLCLTLLSYICSELGLELKVLAQLPTEPKLDDVEKALAAGPNCTVIRDPEARNTDAIVLAFKHMLGSAKA